MVIKTLCSRLRGRWEDMVVGTLRNSPEGKYLYIHPTSVKLHRRQRE